MKWKSSLPSIAAVIVLWASPRAEANLGSTLAQCVERFGAVRATMPAVVADSDAEAARFDDGSLGVIVHFKQGTAWHISYAKGYISDPDKRRLLKENGATGEWMPRLGELSGNIFVWNNRDAGMVACAVNNKSLNSLEIMTRACAEAFARARAQRIEAAALTLAGQAPPSPPAGGPTTDAEKPAAPEAAPEAGPGAGP
ncbi:MAG: hypothetical protein ACKV19_07525, partial [Verrucomicrobiales bacterium]